MPPLGQIAEAGAPAALQTEIRQTRPFKSRGHEAYLALLRTADQARHRFAALFEQEDLTLQQYNVLRILRGAGDAGLPTLEVADRMIERTPGITRLMDVLEGQGLVTRERPKTDRRTVLCRVTPAGLTVLARLDGPVEDLDRDTFMRLDAEDLDDLVEILSRLRALLSG